MDRIVSFHFATPSCPAVAKLLPGEFLRCRTPGGSYGAYGTCWGPRPAAADVLAKAGHGNLVRIGQGPCMDCPLAGLPPEVLPLDVEVRSDGVRAELAVREQGVLDLTAWFRQRGQGPRLLNVSRQSSTSTLALVDLTRLTPRQLEALGAALEGDYFQGGGLAGLADRLGCSRSTAHEHLSKGLQRVLEAVLEQGVEAPARRRSASSRPLSGAASHA